jgi:hypothetical protein
MEGRAVNTNNLPGFWLRNRTAQFVRIRERTRGAAIMGDTLERGLRLHARPGRVEGRLRQDSISWQVSWTDCTWSMFARW